MKSFLGMWNRLYDSLLDLVFYSPCGGERRFRRKCLDFASPVKREEILDVCCGTGTFTCMIAGRVGLVGQVTGLDSCGSAVKAARKQKSSIPVKFLVANAESLPFTASRFDKCFVVLGLHHLPEQARRNTLSEIFRTLKPTGRLFIVDYNLPDKGVSKLVAKALVKLDKSREAYAMLINSNLLRDIRQAGFNVERREFVYKGAIQLIEARKQGKPA